VTDELDHQVRMALRRRRRSPLFSIAIIVFAVCATAVAYLWISYGNGFKQQCSPRRKSRTLPPSALSSLSVAQILMLLNGR